MPIPTYGRTEMKVEIVMQIGRSYYSLDYKHSHHFLTSLTFKFESSLSRYIGKYLVVCTYKKSVFLLWLEVQFGPSNWKNCTLCEKSTRRDFKSSKKFGRWPDGGEIRLSIFNCTFPSIAAVLHCKCSLFNYIQTRVFSCLVPHLKDIIHICLKIKVQGFWVTFKLHNLGSK